MGEGEGSLAVLYDLKKTPHDASSKGGNTSISLLVDTFLKNDFERVEHDLLSCLDGIQTSTTNVKVPSSLYELNAALVILQDNQRIPASFTDQESASILVLIKKLSRLLSKCVKTYDWHDRNCVHLDALAAPILQVLSQLIHLLHLHIQATQDTNLNSTEPMETALAWALYASSTFLSGRFPTLTKTTAPSLHHTELIYQTIQQILGKTSHAETISKVFHRFVTYSSQEISKEIWIKKGNAAKLLLQWALSHVSFPNLGGELLGRLLAQIFPLIDSLEDATQRIGAQMLLHVIKNVTPTELRWYSDVLLEVLKVAISSRVPETLDLLLECLGRTLEMVSAPGEEKYYDLFFPRLLQDASLTTDVALRTLFLRHLRPLIHQTGAPRSLQLIRYLQPLLKVIVNSFESINAEMMQESLETLRVVLVAAWPRVPGHREMIFLGVMRAVAYCELFSGDTEVAATSAREKESILEASERILLLLEELTRDCTRLTVLEMLRQVTAGVKGLETFGMRVEQAIRNTSK